MDGANMNAQVGITSPKKIEIDLEDEILKKSCVSYDVNVLNI